MSVSFAHLEPPSETSFLRDRVKRLRASLEWASEAISPKVRAAVLESVDRCEQRLDLGVDWTVVALAGGTGSGKSSLFNAISGMDFAVAGVSRPTTAHVSAASWGGKAEELLDWLGVARERRLECETALDDDGEHRLNGMILLDLPDHDSVNAANRKIVDKVVPMADLLVWVVDPQKYADHALHSRYLQGVADFKAPSAVVLNQVDRLARADADAIMFDIRRLLAEKKIEDVPVMLTSARTGMGVQSLRGAIAVAVSKRSVAAEAVRAELVAAGRTLAKALAKDAEPVLPDFDAFVDGLAVAAGVDARADAAAAVAGGLGGEVPETATLTAAAVHPLREAWLDDATAGLPRAWRAVLNKAMPKARGIAETVNVALEVAPWPDVPAAKPKRFGKPKPVAEVGESFRDLGRRAIAVTIEGEIVGPTETMHQSYRALDELTSLGVEQKPRTQV